MLLVYGVIAVSQIHTAMRQGCEPDCKQKKTSYVAF